MSFTMDVGQIMQYAYNVFASSQLVLYLFIGASFGIFVLTSLMKLGK